MPRYRERRTIEAIGDYPFWMTTVMSRRAFSISDRVDWPQPTTKCIGNLT